MKFSKEFLKNVQETGELSKGIVKQVTNGVTKGIV